ncbi:hypothetical protein L596_008941 [Steinernema carpocapsae]|uniref:Uncharacterized protein n=1 Tax=Steinernema carpocapsae TaxID=34508 RepID=A0A4U5PDZ4_STECR|nr:hypothetical protein L596_008941 [Steinernema carpocapsae]
MTTRLLLLLFAEAILGFALVQSNCNCQTIVDGINVEFQQLYDVANATRFLECKSDPDQPKYAAEYMGVMLFFVQLSESYCAPHREPYAYKIPGNCTGLQQVYDDFNVNLLQLYAKIDTACQCGCKKIPTQIHV